MNFLRYDGIQVTSCVNRILIGCYKLDNIQLPRPIMNFQDMDWTNFFFSFGFHSVSADISFKLLRL